MRHRTVSQKELTVFWDCPRQWHYEYVEGLIPKYSSSAFSIGKAFHAALAVWYSQQSEEAAMNVISNAEALAAIESAELIRDVEITRGMVMAYLQRYGYNDVANYDVLSVEEVFDEPDVIVKPNLVHLTPKDADDVGMSIGLRGIMDLIVQDKATGEKWVIEHKTTGRKNASDFLIHIPCDFQAMIYIIKGLSEYPDLTGIVYNLAGKPGIRRKLRSGETFEEFTARIISYYFPEDSKDKPNGIAFERGFVRVTKEDKKTYEEEILNAVIGMEILQYLPHMPPNARKCQSSRCPFKPLCLEGISDGRIDLLFDRKE